jgi:HK97 family phage major capsid protein
VRFSNQLLSDSYFDLEQLLSRLTASRIGRGIEKLLTSAVDATGTPTPNNPGISNIAQTATTTGSIAAGIGWTDLENTFDALDAAFLPRSVWQMSSKTRNYLAGLKDSTSRPYFTPGTDGGMDYLLGRPIVLNQSLPSPTAGVFAANAKPTIFGSLFDGLQVISSEVRVQTLSERFAEFNESAIIVSTRVGSASLQAGAIQALKIAAA